MKDKDIIRKLKYWLKPIDRIFADFSTNVLDGNDKDKHRIFIDRKSDVLFVAHLDTVQIPKYVKHRKTKSGRLKRIYAQGLDDRLGCMIAYELSRELKANLLLTDCEESRETTIKYHDCKEYNWIVEFDRAGDDVVTYGLSSIDFNNAIKETWTIGMGLYSDICNVESSACCFNLGIGYELAHSKDSYFDVKTMRQQIKLFKEFYGKYKSVSFERDPIDYDDLMEYDSDYLTCWNSRTNISCDVCGMVNATSVYGWNVCCDCFEDMIYERVLGIVEEKSV